MAEAVDQARTVVPRHGGLTVLTADDLLAEDLVTVLAGEPFGLPVATLARRLRRRDGDVRRVLRARHDRFFSMGQTRGRRWRLISVEVPGALRAREGAQAGIGRNLGGDPNSQATPGVTGAEAAAQ
jgi:hypothetical protein